MPLPKYKKYYQLMREQNAAAFDAFSKIHAAYLLDRKTHSHAFHRDGQPIVDLIRDWERRLCAGMERGNNGQYSNKVAEKFWQEAKAEFSHIERVGVRSNLD